MSEIRTEKIGFVTENVGCCLGCGRDVKNGQRCVCDRIIEKNKANEKPAE